MFLGTTLPKQEITAANQPVCFTYIPIGDRTSLEGSCLEQVAKLHCPNRDPAVIPANTFDISIDTFPNAEDIPGFFHYTELQIDYVYYYCEKNSQGAVVPSKLVFALFKNEKLKII